MSQVHPRTGLSEFRLFLSGVTLAAAGLYAGTARAEEACAPGDWFCEPSSTPETAPPPPPAEVPGTDDATEPGEPAPHERRSHRFREYPPFEPHGFRPRPRRPMLRWGVDAHVFGALLDGQNGTDAGMGGIGTGLRYRIYPEFAVEGSFELGFGTDYNGNDRTEGALLLHAVGILNPRSIVRAYVFGGLGLSAARVSGRRAGATPLWPSRHRDYSYIGFDVGAGAEVRISPRFGLHFDVLGFVRDRTDSDRDVPEFVDPDTGRTTNSSGGGLLRVGGMFYF